MEGTGKMGKGWEGDGVEQGDGACAECEDDDDDAEGDDDDVAVNRSEVS